MMNKKYLVIGGLAGVVLLIGLMWTKGTIPQASKIPSPSAVTFTPLIDPQGFYVDLESTAVTATASTIVAPISPTEMSSATSVSAEPASPSVTTALGWSSPMPGGGSSGGQDSPSSGKNPKITATPSPREDRTVLRGPLAWTSPGVELIQLDNGEIWDRLGEIGVGWIRINGLLWSEVEPGQGERKWDKLARLESGLAEAARRNVNVIVIVRSTPLWAQKAQGTFCGAIKRGKLDAFGDFMYDMVKRYSSPPYHVKYWEIWNEPDVDPSLVPGDSGFGCWGDEGDPYYGGEYYAEMLKAVYPMVKLADPEAKVLLGGLLLDCDPTLTSSDKACLRGNFLEGVLRNDGGNYFDIVSYHAYPAYLGDMRSVMYYSDWEQRGGILMGKVDFLREVMERYNQNKPLMNTETSFLCPEWSKAYCNPPKADFFEAQADYVPRLYVRNLAAGVAATYWYAFDETGWRYSSALDGNRNPKPAFSAFLQMRRFLEGTTYLGPLAMPEGFEGYEFDGGTERIWVVWTKEDKLLFLPKPDGFLGAYDKFGGAVTLEIDQIPIRRPVYIFLSK